ncbi:unnamed protein product [Thlaspi arvense]|uniref:Uncharacterized protein n=1 Tax=Thlaspi arvense TaxID=13288 RepID=A0AAU9SKA9_THLAR|nr:unnamed protein product [Thlaspi arvense]
MADSSSFLPPLCERISYKSYVLSAVVLTILGLLFSLLLYRILYMNQYDTVWVVAFLCEACYSFMWLLFTNVIWSPAKHKSYPDRLDERVQELPSVDIFVTTADPVKEPSILVVNTVLSLLALNYPANKLACYVSDDGCSPLTYFSLKEALKFANIWVPFCKKYNVKVRAPFRYFLDSLDTSMGFEFTKDWEMMKREYEKLSQKVEDATRDSNWLDSDNDFEAFSSTKPTDHSTIVKVIWENKGGVGDEKEVPHLVYISREKRPNYFHHYKAGAMNFLVRVSGLMTNAPYMLNVDCDMYANEADVVRQAMCIFLEESTNPNHCAFVQCRHDFYDNKSNELINMEPHVILGIAGIQGPFYYGTGCFHTRRVIYGLSPDDLGDDESLASAATRKLSTEESLVREFGNSKEMVKSVVGALQRHLYTQRICTNSIEAAKEVGNIHYEHQTNWGKTVGWLYDSLSEDLNTCTRIHSRGWTSSSIYMDPPAFRGCMPPVGVEAFPQMRRWMTGSMEVFFNKQSPLIGMFQQKLKFRQRLAYLAASMSCLSPLSMLLYCPLPAYSLLHNTILFPKGISLGIIITLLGMHFLYTLWEFMTSPGLSIESWYVPMSSSLFSVFDITLKLLGISRTVFIVTKKTVPETKSGSGDAPSHLKDNGMKPDSGNSEFVGSLFFLPGTFILLVNLAALADFWMGLRMRSRSGKEGGSGLEEVCGCIFVAISFLPFLKGLFLKGKYGIPLSTLSKAAFLAVLFVVFSLGN